MTFGSWGLNLIEKILFECPGYCQNPPESSARRDFVLSS